MASETENGGKVQNVTLGAGGGGADWTQVNIEILKDL